jgi:hypothetical protein
MQFHVEKWNQRGNEYTMVILTEEDIEIKKATKIKGFGYEILVIPNRYKDIVDDYVEYAKHITLIRGGEIIYV